jgi:hypothetical protein
MRRCDNKISANFGDIEMINVGRMIVETSWGLNKDEGFAIESMPHVGPTTEPANQNDFPRVSWAVLE